jgi:hypothetical protein
MRRASTADISVSRVNHDLMRFSGMAKSACAAES